MVPECKPSPDDLLRRAEVEERRRRRGRLKVFLGYASHVGKSYRMFDEGRRRRERGEDVVAGAVQRVVSPDIAAILDRIERIPTVSDAMDMAALLRRRPAVCLIDGLASDNPAGSRHQHRWQDVEELLASGIGVITALNLQHIREQQDEVERITGRRAAHSVPAAFLAEADEIEVVDSPLETMVDRTPALPYISQLREMALLLAADVVDRQLEEYLDNHGLKAVPSARERILVCMTPYSDAATMLRGGRRNADRFHGTLLAIWVEQPGLSPADRGRLDRNMALARELGAEVHCLKGGDFVETLLDFARRERITQVFAGHSPAARPRWWKRSAVERLMDAAGDFDLCLFPHKAPE